MKKIQINRSLMSNKNETVKRQTKNPPNKEKPDGLTVEFYQTFKEEFILAFLKLFHKIQRETTLSNSLCEARITLILKGDDITKKENYMPISLMNTDEKKILKKYLQTKFNNTLISYIIIKSGLFQECKDGSTYVNQKIYNTETEEQKKSHDHFNKCRKSL
jgi:hypothetical protein